MTASVNVANDGASGDPKKCGDHYGGEYYVVLEKFHKSINVDVLNDVPKTFNDIVHRSLTISLKNKDA